MCDLQLVDMKATHRSEEHTSELQSLAYLVCRLLLEKKNTDSRSTSRHQYTGASIHSSERYTRRSLRFGLETLLSFPLSLPPRSRVSVFFFNDTATTEIYTLSLHDALPIYQKLSVVSQTQAVARAVALGL